MKIVLLCEGRTEKALQKEFKRHLDAYAHMRNGPRVGLAVLPVEHRVDNCVELVRRLNHHAKQADVLGVVALADVYPCYTSAEEVKEALRRCVEGSPHQDRFHAHAAQFEVEAWLLPFWEDIAKRLEVKAKPPGAKPEEVDSEKPPSRHLKELFARAREKYEKPIDAAKILNGRIEKAAEHCPQLKSLLETLCRLCDAAAA